MKRLLVRNKVKDFDVWKEIFDGEFDRAGTFGVELEHLWRCEDDPSEVFFMLTVESRERAETFMADPASAEAGERSGVIDGEVWFVE